jgi:hypothetical protein
MAARPLIELANSVAPFTVACFISPLSAAAPTRSAPVLWIEGADLQVRGRISADFYDGFRLRSAYSMDCGLAVLAGNTEVVTRESE